MFKLEIENKNGAKLQLTQNESNYQIVNASGLTPPTAKIETTTVANMDGEKFKSSRLEMRNIVLLIALRGDVEKNRIALYDFFDVGQYCKIYYSNGTRNVYVEGYCEQIEGDFFSQSEQMQISIICAEPFWKSFNLITVDLSQVFGGFEFPFSIDNEGVSFSDFISNREVVVINGGEIKCGVVITLTAEIDNIINPAIYNVKTGESLKINTTLNLGDIVVINTNKGEKAIEKIVDGVSANIIGTLETGSTWFQLEKGVNLFTYRADVNSSGLRVLFEYHNLYKGV